MYVQHFGLEHEPFSIAPDPRYLYLGERHREALAHLLYGLGGGGGFVLLTGEVGAGKTTVCRGFLEQVPPHCQVAYVFNPKLTVAELLAVVCEEFGIEVPAGPAGQGAPTVKQYVDPLNRFLLEGHAAGRNAVLVIDEAQQLAPDVLEQLRLLTNLETNERKLLQIVLVGQPELRDLLARPGLEQLAQRVIARYHLGPLDEADTGHYVQHRLAVAGLRGPSPIPATLMPRLHRLTGGVPRRINLLCDRALLGAYSQGRAAVDARTLAQAAREVRGEPVAGDRRLRAMVPRWAGPAAAFALGGIVVGAWLGGLPGEAAAPWPAAARPAQAAASAPGPSEPGASGPSQLTATLGAEALARRLRSPRLDEADAWQQLALRWNVSLAAGEPCAAAQRQQLACFRSRGGLAELRELDRPAILVLRDGASAPLHVLLVGLDRERAWLQFGAERHGVTLADLAGWWRGEFATLWRMAPTGEGGTPDLPGGDEAALLHRLATAPGAGASAADASLQSRLTAFQLTQGLVPDGRPGPLTLMALNRATGVSEPRLDPRP